MPSAAALLRSAETALMRCSAALQGTIFSNHVPGPICEKSVISASGTAMTFMMRSSRQRNAAGKMRAGEFQNPGIGGKRHRRTVVVTGRAQTPLVQPVSVNEAERLHLPLDIMDFQHSRLGMGLADEGTETAASFNQAPLHQLAQSLVHRHARAGILPGHLVFEGNAISRRPFARHDVALDIVADAFVQ